MPILVLVGCGKAEEEKPLDQPIKKEEKITSKLDVKSYGFASSIVLDQLVRDDDNNYQVDYTNDFSKIESLDFDVAVIPAYRMVDLYKKSSGKIKLAAISLVDNIRLISDGQINNPMDLRGKTIMVPKLTDPMNKAIESKLKLLKPVLGINLEFYEGQKELYKNLDAKENIIALLTEPYYTKAIKNRDYYVFDIMKTLSMLPNNDLDSEGELLSELIIVNSDFLKDNKESFDKFLKSYQKIQEEIGEDTIISQDIINKYDITNKEALDIYKRLKNTFISGDTMKGVFELYLNRLENFDKNIFDGRTSDDIYYIGKK